MAINYIITAYPHQGGPRICAMTFQEIKRRARLKAEGLGYDRVPDGWKSAADLIRYLFDDCRSAEWQRTSNDH